MCRLCGEHSAVREDCKQISKGNFEKQIRLAFGIEIGDDDDMIHPPFIRRPCELKMSKW